jgi:hypothetical protein
MGIIEDCSWSEQDTAKREEEYSRLLEGRNSDPGPV